MNVNKYYVYLHRTSTGKVVYVGKGTGVRAWESKRTSPLHSRWIEWHLNQGSTKFCEVISYYLSEEDALDEEKYTIKHYEKFGSKLFNDQHSKYRRSKWKRK